ncbi:MAG TPA: efflux RND transporter permease subunit [Candidatus Sulfotelmatobacter sp.]|nr:efflux RND transporter permease subunit [Candidatus Sulfotelmatobacter sp.]
MAHRSDNDYIQHEHNTARFFVENRQISWILLLATVALGVYGYTQMPKRKDPNIPVRVASVITQWPGATAQQVEQLVTRPLETTIAENPHIRPPMGAEFGIKSLSMPGLSIIQVQLSDDITDSKKEFSDMNLKLNSVSLPQGAGPVKFNSDFGDTAALMLTVASPLEDKTTIAVRARAVEVTIERARAARKRKSAGTPVSIVDCFPESVPVESVGRALRLFVQDAEAHQLLSNTEMLTGPGFVVADGFTNKDDATLYEEGRVFVQARLHESEIHPDAWPPILVHDPSQLAPLLTTNPGNKYTYHELENFTDLLSRALRGAPEVSRVDTSGVLPEQVYLDYSQERLASYGLQPSNLKSILNARNITLPGGALEAGSKNIIVDPSGEFATPEDIGNVIVGTSGFGAAVYLRDLVDIRSGYQSPARYLNYYTWKDGNGNWHRTRAVTLAVQMREGEQIGRFSKNVRAKLAETKQLLPADLMIASTSDQPRQVQENVDLFMDALYEAIALVVLVSLVGFWEWRSALLMALSIPITLAMTFGFAHLLGIDLQQVSIATLIIALGLLVDDPVVAGDSIKRSLVDAHPPVIAAWLGPTKLAHAILFATITNIVAYLPFLLLTGTTGEFLYSLPVVMTCALVASRLVSMTFIPFLGYYLLRPAKKAEKSIEEKRTSGFTGFYYHTGKFAIEHRWLVFAGSLLFLALGGYIGHQLKTQFFPDDVQYLSFLDVWLPNDVPLFVTNQTAMQVENVIRDTADKYAREHAGKDGKAHPVLKSITTFEGGGGPRFWFSVTPQLQQLNYAQLIVELYDKDDTPKLIGPLQAALSQMVVGARVDVRQLQTNPVDYPVELRVTGLADINPLEEEKDITNLRTIASKAATILGAAPGAARVRDDWGQDGFEVTLKVDPDRANLAGVTNQDVAQSSSTALSGAGVTTLRRGDQQIPVVSRLRMEERANLSDIQNLYVYSSQSNNKVPLLTVSTVQNVLQTLRIRHLEHFRTISVQAFTAPGKLPSEVFAAAAPQIEELRKTLPPGYSIKVSGEQAKQEQGFKNLTVVMAVSIALIFLALAFQFKHSIKPFLVLAAAPYGVVGALIALYAMRSSFGFMAFLGIASLIGVIVSHVIVLFDFIEEMHEKGEPLELALLDAGIVRLRPVMITVGATILALFPLAVHGGPLWQPLCYAQIGGLGVATFITLLLVPVLYSIFVLDLKLVKWEGPQEKPELGEAALAKGETE